ncbi:MAG: NAD(P)H-binding protein [Thermoanaerobaculia bacterium]
MTEEVESRVPRRALLAGATGLVGAELLQVLLASVEYQRVHLVQRRPGTVEHSKAIEHLVSFDELSSLEIEDRITDAFCALGTTIAKAGSVEQLQKVDRDYVRDFGRVAKKVGAERLSVVSALGADPKSINYFNRTKGEMEALLAELDLPSLRIFRPSLLLGSRQERRPKEVVAGVVLGALSPLLAGPLKRYRGVEAAQVARAMYVTSLEDFSGVRIFESDEIQKY